MGEGQERGRLVFPGRGYLSLAGAGWATGYLETQAPTSTPSLMLTSPQHAIVRESSEYWFPRGTPKATCLRIPNSRGLQALS